MGVFGKIAIWVKGPPNKANAPDQPRPFTSDGTNTVPPEAQKDLEELSDYLTKVAENHDFSEKITKEE